MQWLLFSSGVAVEEYRVNAMAKRRRREYLILLDNAKAATLSAIDAFNRVNHPYRDETTLMLLSNGWELLAKAILVQNHQSINTRRRDETISAAVAISRLLHRKDLEKHETETVQQIISLRNEASHHCLPKIPEEIIHHLLFFGCKFFRDVVKRKFPSHARDLEKNYLSLSFSDLTTYADRVQKSVSKIKTSEGDKKLVWLLERGIDFDGKSYITSRQFEQKYAGKKRIMPYLKIGDFLKAAEMIRIVPVEAPRNFTADINLRKGSTRDSSLPVVVRKTNFDEDYPHLTKELAEALGKSQNFIARTIWKLGIKGDPKYHHEVRTSKRGGVQRYSELAKEYLAKTFRDQPDFDPYET
jgi:Domain of unknown function (DUF3644)